MISVQHAKRWNRLMPATTSLTLVEFEDLPERYAAA
jgi:hypothetical protein